MIKENGANKNQSQVNKYHWHERRMRCHSLGNLVNQDLRGKISCRYLLNGAG